MSVLDLIILAALAAAGVAGYRAGLLARVLSWIGLALGLVVAVRLLPWAVDRANGGEAQRTLLVAAVVLVAGGFIGQAIGMIAGHKVRGFIPHGRARRADKTAGAFVGGLGVLVSVWLLLPALANVPGWPAKQTRNSLVARVIDANSPRPPNTLDALESLVGEHGPQVFDRLRPAPDTGEPPIESGLSVDADARVRKSIVKVVGQACSKIQEGSGFVVQEDVVVTNAHVVAGEEKVQVINPEGEPLVATVALFDAGRDLAILRIDGLGMPALGVGIGDVGATGAVYGHPGGSAATQVSPARISQLVDARGRDLYDSRDTQRQVYILAAHLEPGDSGGPLVNVDGRAVGVAFAIAPDRPGTAYALTIAELDMVLNQYRANPAQLADTGPCLE